MRGLAGRRIRESKRLLRLPTPMAESSWRLDHYSDPLLSTAADHRTRVAQQQVASPSWSRAASSHSSSVLVAARPYPRSAGSRRGRYPAKAADSSRDRARIEFVHSSSRFGRPGTVGRGTLPRMDRALSGWERLGASGVLHCQMLVRLRPARPASAAPYGLRRRSCDGCRNFGDPGGLRRSCQRASCPSVAGW